MAPWASRSVSVPPTLPDTGMEIYLAARPAGMLSPSTDFGVRWSPVPSVADLLPGTALVRVLYVSVDPAMRGWMSAARSYIRPVEVGAKMRAAGVGEVVGSAAGLRVGELVSGMLGWCEYAVMATNALARVSIPHGMTLSSALGVLGGTGLTAFFGLEKAAPKAGDVVVVSAAAGATGSVVAQLAKRVHSCTVIGIAGGSEKCSYLVDELGLDAAVDRKAEVGVDAGLEAALGSRTIDVYFDSVGGATLESALRRLSIGARIVICGAIGSYNAGTGDAAPGPRNYMQLLVRRATMSGFVVLDYAARYAEARARLAAWVAAGKVRAREDVTDGLTRAPDALLGLFKGTNRGKVVVRVASAGFRRGGTADTGERWSKL